jgi:hypothetical protein
VRNQHSVQILARAHHPALTLLVGSNREHISYASRRGPARNQGDQEPGAPRPDHRRRRSGRRDRAATAGRRPPGRHRPARSPGPFSPIRRATNSASCARNDPHRMTARQGAAWTSPQSGIATEQRGRVRPHESHPYLGKRRHRDALHTSGPIRRRTARYRCSTRASRHSDDSTGAHLDRDVRTSNNQTLATIVCANNAHS